MSKESLLDFALRTFDDLLLDGKFDLADTALAQIGWETCDLDFGVTVLMTTKPARDRLPTRAACIARFVARADVRGRPKIEPCL